MSAATMNTNTKFFWLRRNLFANAMDSALTVLTFTLCGWFSVGLIAWANTTANWSVVSDNLRVFMVGTFPQDMAWRPWVSTAILSALCGIALGQIVGSAKKINIPLLALAAMFGVYALVGGTQTLLLASCCIALASASWWLAGTLAVVRKAALALFGIGVVAVAIILAPGGLERWGGLLMSVLFTVLASVLSVPLGIALAFGRRSRFASLRIICSSYIEVMRALPLILVVYCIWIVIPLLTPNNAGPDLIRGLLGFTLFFAAYVAEYVRSGLQSIPKGQSEAAQSLGMTPIQVSRDIVLPQALRVVMPALVGNVLDIFNTVPLLFIIGMTDFLRAGQMVLVNPQYGNRTYEIYAFMFAVYLAVASLVTYGARRLEKRMAVGSH